jgi:excisionase family DNA binding protein
MTDASSNELAWPSEEAFPHLMTIHEAGKALRISKWTVYRLINARQLKTVRIGRKRLVPVSAMEALVNRLQAEEVW